MADFFRDKNQPDSLNQIAWFLLIYDMYVIDYFLCKIYQFLYQSVMHETFEHNR